MKKRITVIKKKTLQTLYKLNLEIYSPAFVSKILQSREDIKNGKGVKIVTADMWK